MWKEVGAMNRQYAKWECECGKVIVGKRNTIHLGVLAHTRKHLKDCKDNIRELSSKDSCTYKIVDSVFTEL
jgi:hypothetical protein